MQTRTTDKLWISAARQAQALMGAWRGVHHARVARRRRRCNVPLPRQRASAAIGDAGLGDLVVRNGVVIADVGRAHDPGHAQLAQLLINQYFLTSGDDERAVWQFVDHQCRDFEFDLFVAGNSARAAGLRGRSRPRLYHEGHNFYDG